MSHPSLAKLKNLNAREKASQFLFTISQISGFSRLNIPWFASDDELDFVMTALEMVASEGWKLLPQYRLNNETGEWKHFENIEYKERKWLGHITYNHEGQFSFTDKFPSLDCDLSAETVIQEAKEVFNSAKKNASRRQIPDQTLLFADEISSA